MSEKQKLPTKRNLKPLKDFFMRVLKAIWKGIGSSHFSNIISLASLAVTVFLTLYIFEYTNRQEKSSVEVQIDIVPTRYSKLGQNWDVNIDLQNRGPADIAQSNFFIKIKQSPNVQLVGFAYKDFTTVVAEPTWGDVLPTPAPSMNGSYTIPIESFENGDSLTIRLVFDVEKNVSDSLNEKWSSLGIIKVPDPQGGGHYYDFSNVDSNEYANLISNFIEWFTMSGEHVSLTGHVSSSDLRYAPK